MRPFFQFFLSYNFFFLWNFTGYWIFKGRENGSKCGPNWNVDQVVLGENMQSGCQRHWCIGKADENDLLTLVHLFQFHSLFSFPFTFLIKAYGNHFCCAPFYLSWYDCKERDLEGNTDVFCPPLIWRSVNGIRAYTNDSGCL